MPPPIPYITSNSRLLDKMLPSLTRFARENGVPINDACVFLQPLEQAEAIVAALMGRQGGMTPKAQNAFAVYCNLVDDIRECEHNRVAWTSLPGCSESEIDDFLREQQEPQAMNPKPPIALVRRFQELIENSIGVHDYTADDVEAALAALGYHAPKRDDDPATVKPSDVLTANDLRPDLKLFPVKIGGDVAVYVPLDSSPIAAKTVARALNLVRDHPDGKPPLEHYMKANHAAVWNNGSDPIFVNQNDRDSIDIRCNGIASVKVLDTHHLRITFDGY